MTPSRRRAAAILLDCLLILLMCWSLTRPLFKAKYLDKFDSIESTFISDARFLKDHWPHPGWHPLWYCGTRFDYIYPPALRYGTALLSNFWIPPKAYHVYTAFFYAMGILGVYVLVLVGARSRLAGLLAAAATATLSPSFAFISAIRVDSSWMTPQRLGVLVRYGEGPHMTALALLPFALACAYFGLRRGRPAALAGAAVFSALVVSNNFYGATALAIFFPILVWSLWVTHRDNGIWLRAAAIAALAYGLTAFWLSPSYLRVTLENMQFVSERGNSWSAALAAVVAAAYAFATWKLARGKPERAWTVFVAGALLFFSLNVLGQRVVQVPSDRGAEPAGARAGHGHDSGRARRLAAAVGVASGARPVRAGGGRGRPHCRRIRTRVGLPGPRARDLSAAQRLPRAHRVSYGGMDEPQSAWRARHGLGFRPLLV